MVYFLAGCALLVLVLLGLRALAGADPHKLASGLRKAAGVAVLAVAGFLAIRGALPLAIPLAVFGLALFRRGGGSGFGGIFGSGRKSPGQKSQVRTEWVVMELDHDSGSMDGECLKGRFAGKTLSSLSDAEAFDLLHEVRSDGAQEAALIEAYLDWRLPGWRDRVDEEAGSRYAHASGFSERMSVEEAYAVLGVGSNASEEEIRQAHRRLMLKMHPDQGGTNYLAARINEAKEVLLGRK
jgi:DnaJ domain